MRANLEAYMARKDERGNPRGTGTFASRPLRSDLIAKCLDAGNGASVDEIGMYLADLYLRREQSPLHDNGPKDWGWFPVVIARRFSPDPVLESSQQDQKGHLCHQSSHQTNRKPRGHTQLPQNSPQSPRTRKTGPVKFDARQIQNFLENIS